MSEVSSNLTPAPSTLRLGSGLTPPVSPTPILTATPRQDGVNAHATNSDDKSTHNVMSLNVDETICTPRNMPRTPAYKEVVTSEGGVDTEDEPTTPVTTPMTHHLR
jgi:hypothetical protein